MKYCKIPDFNHLFNIMPEPRLIVDVQDGRPDVIVQCNNNASAYFRREKNLIIGHKFSELVSSESALHLDQSFQVCIARNMIPPGRM